MEITTQQMGEALEVRVIGRLDAYWADHLARALEEAVRAGSHRLRVNMAEVPYMSSVGIRVLLRFYKQLQRINGTLMVAEPSEPVRAVLELAGLQVLLAPAPQGAAGAANEARPGGGALRLERAAAVYDVFDVLPTAVLSCRIVGEPGRLDSCRFTAEQCHAVTFTPTAMGVGLGAFGGDFAECRGRFGEFLAAAGAAVYLPTDGTNVPDYLLAAGAFMPQLNVLYALVCDGGFAQLLRFEARPNVGPVPLSGLASIALDIADADAVGMVVVAESAGLMGATLRRSPADGMAADPFAFPTIRDWLSFTPERAFARGVALVAGVAARAPDPRLAPLLRPLQPESALAGHFHAAAFAYRPLQKGYVEMQPTVAALFDGETLQGVLHLLNDDRRITGAGESEFVRGACWIAPLHVAAEG